MFGRGQFLVDQKISVRLRCGFFKMSQQMLKIPGIQVSSQSHDLLSVQRDNKHDKIITISFRCRVFVIVKILIDGQNE